VKEVKEVKEVKKASGERSAGAPKSFPPLQGEGRVGMGSRDVIQRCRLDLLLALSSTEKRMTNELG
jgi:hypothetical protein